MPLFSSNTLSTTAPVLTTYLVASTIFFQSRSVMAAASSSLLGLGPLQPCAGVGEAEGEGEGGAGEAAGATMAGATKRGPM
jgi:hypothetical protein